MKNPISKNLVPGAFLLLLTIFMFNCDQCGEPAPPPPSEVIELVSPVPDFNADSAYYFVEKQVSFGPRVPNTLAHDSCAAWLEKTLVKYVDQVKVQSADVKAFDGTVLSIKNIIGIVNPKAKRRILLCAHWDSRPFADWDSDPENWKTPIDGANDGGSGVGVLIELARQLDTLPEHLGVDIIFFDAEDHGYPEFIKSQPNNHTWCLGSQYWARNPHKPNYSARYGILLDMVGAKNATFTMDQTSMTYAPGTMKKVWQIASKLGYSDQFISTQTGPLIDDHYYINQIAKIPTIDIIHRDMQTRTKFVEHWHTVNDNMEIIDRRTLDVVGQTLLQVIWQESRGKF